MRTRTIAALAGLVALAACETADEGNAFITHVDYRVTAADRRLVEDTLASKLRAPGIRMSRVQGSENLADGSVTVCGYVSGITPAGVRSPEAVFGGVLSANRQTFSIFGGQGKGQDPSRVALVKSICQIAGVHL